MNLSDQFVYFLDNDKFRETDRAGFRRRVVTGENLQLCFWRIAGGATPGSTYQIQLGRASATSDGVSKDVYIKIPTNGSLAAGFP